MIVACYNEEDLLEESVKEIIRVLNNTALSWEIIFIDDCSKDGTREVINKILDNYKDSNFKKYFHPENKGRGRTINDGIKMAEGEIVGFIDIDLESPAHYLPIMVQKMKDDSLDMLIAKRIYKIKLDCLDRFIASVTYVKLVKTFLNLPVSDTESGYKIFRRDRVLPVLDQIKDERWFWDTEIVARGYLAGLKIGELPVVFIRRTDKKSAVKLFRDSARHFKKFWNFQKEFRRALYESKNNPSA